MFNPINIEALRQKRWFMGKSRPIHSIREFDSVEIGDTRLVILEIVFTDGGCDKYAILEDESLIGRTLEEAFAGNSLQSIFVGSQGYFSFKVRGGLPKGSLRNAKPLVGEQSNSAFFVPGRYFFKLYRRLQPGTHPETEILQHLSDSGADMTPELCGECTYKSESGESYALGVLEKFIPGTKNAWDCFCDNMDVGKAFELGKATAKMHSALRHLPGTTEKTDEPPFDKLERLLRESSIKEAGDVLKALQALREKYAQSTAESEVPETGRLAPQRIHGDFHLGQVLIETVSTGGEAIPAFRILDFEGEPARTLDYRRRLRSPAVDIAGMLRSFRYAAASSSQASENAEEAFLKGYAQTAKVAVETLKKAIEPFILSKAIYEACYELEFRPTWFHIPAKALLDTVGK